MRIECLEHDSHIFGRNALAIHEFDPGADFTLFERDYRKRYDPFYVSCKVPLDRVADVHLLEKHGFNLIECQIRSAIKLRKVYDVSPFPYDFEQVTREEDLAGVLLIAGSTFVHDRFSIDPGFPPGISGERYKEYVRRSLDAPDEAVFRLVERATGHTVAFKTHRYVSADEVLFLLGGVHPDMKNVGIGLINEYFEFNFLIGKGIRRGVTHISVANYPVFNLEIGHLGFRVLTTYAVMRKLYPRA